MNAENNTRVQQYESHGSLMVSTQVRQYEGPGFKSRSVQIVYLHGVRLLATTAGRRRLAGGESGCLLSCSFTGALRMRVRNT